jgi:dTMP kinase
VRDRGATDRFESEHLGFFEKVRAAYLDRVDKYPDRIKRVDASGSLGSVHAGITIHLDHLIEMSK